MYKWDEIDKEWVDNNKELLYEYYAHIQTTKPLPIIEYILQFEELLTHQNATSGVKSISINYKGIADTILDSSFDFFDNQSIYFKRTLKEFNKYCLRKNNLNILLNT